MQAQTKAKPAKAKAATDVAVVETPKAEKPAPFDHAAARATASALFAKLDKAVSIPVKAARTFRAYNANAPIGRVGKTTPRQAAMLALACVANSKALPTDGGKPVTFSRRFTIGGVEYLAENGCTSDVQSSGLATYDAKTETFTVNDKQAIAIRGQLGAVLSGFAI